MVRNNQPYKCALLKPAKSREAKADTDELTTGRPNYTSCRRVETQKILQMAPFMEPYN
ncbi:hypothetical protein ACMD2_10808, partial [Ananas comosus]